MNHHLIPNWTDSVGETYEFRTTVFTSHSGKEQRMAERRLARRTVSFSTLLWDKGLRDFQDLMHDRGAEAISIPDPARYAATLNLDAPIGATEIIIDSSPAWLAPGIELSLSDLSETEFRTGGAVVNVGGFSVDFDSDDFDVNRRARITLTTPLARAWTRGTAVRPTITGRMSKEVKLDYRSDSVASAAIMLAVLPPSDSPILGAENFQTFNGRPVFLTAPNWTQPPSVTHNTPFEEVDYGRGVSRAFLPIEFYTRITQFNYLGRSRETIGELLSLFLAMRGRQGEFYCPTWTTDMIPVSGIAAGTDVVTVLGAKVAEVYGDTTVNKAVAIRLTDGRWILRQVTDFIATTESGYGPFGVDFGDDFDSEDVGLFTRLKFDSPITETIFRKDMTMICWLNVSRFASDTLSLRWMTDDLAQATAQIMTLEALSPDP